MTALTWQALIAGSILSAFIIGRVLLPVRTAIKLGTATAGFWLLWTLGLSSLFVGYAITGPLQSFQLWLIVSATLIALGALGIHYHNARQRERLQENLAFLKGELSNLKEAFDDLQVPASIEPAGLVQGAKAHRAELIRLIRATRKRLIILSGWITEYALDRQLKRELQNALARGVHVHIGWGWQTNPQAVAGVWKPNAAEVWLKDLEKKHAGRLVTAHFRNHAKLLLCDAQAILGSHNWLSNVSSPNEELSLAVTDPHVVDSIWSAVAPRFEKEQEPHRRPNDASTSRQFVGA